jgi:hypothetical protein
VATGVTPRAPLVVGACAAAGGAEPAQPAMSKMSPHTTVQGRRWKRGGLAGRWAAFNIIRRF